MTGDSSPSSTATPPLPGFRYHPDPLATGSIKASQRRCICCGRDRGYIYTGPTYCEVEVDEELCPWCIANGNAARHLRATFNEIVGPGANTLPAPVVAEVTQRTPGFSGWQQERWLTHCNDAAIFLGPVGIDELEAAGRSALRAIRDEVASRGWDDAQVARHLAALSKTRSPTAYLFRCAHCASWLGYSDFT